MTIKNALKKQVETKLLNINKAYIYLIINSLNGKIYVGSSAKNIRNRFAKHISELNLNRHHSPHLQSAWNYYGHEAFHFCIVESVEDISKLYEIEQLWIDSVDSKLCYNTAMVAGSPLGLKRSDETKEKLRKAIKLRKPISEETRIKMSISAKNKIFSEQHRINLSKAHIGKTHKEESKNKISKALRNKKKSQEHVLNMWTSRWNNG